MPIRILRNICLGAADLTYPIHCVVCRRSWHSVVCAQCLDKITHIVPPVCARCGLPTDRHICGVCRTRKFHFEKARSAAVFEGALREAIHALKYRNLKAVADPLIEVMNKAYPFYNYRNSIDMIIPIPVHWSRIVERGFNQSELLARGIARHLSIRLESAMLYKAFKTPHQADLPFEQRLTNVAGSFAVRNAYKLQGKRALLIDDVMTTGATLDEAARALLEAGASSVVAYTLSRSL